MRFNLADYRDRLVEYMTEFDDARAKAKMSVENKWTEILTKATASGLQVVGPFPDHGFQMSGPGWVKWVGTDQDEIIALLDHLAAGGQTEVIFTQT